MGAALEVIPRTLAQNCGANVIRTLTQLRARHADAAGATFGIDGNKGARQPATCLHARVVDGIKGAWRSSCCLHARYVYGIKGARQPLLPACMQEVCSAARVRGGRCCMHAHASQELSTATRLCAAAICMREIFEGNKGSAAIAAHALVDEQSTLCMPISCTGRTFPSTACAQCCWWSVVLHRPQCSGPVKQRMLTSYHELAGKLLQQQRATIGAHALVHQGVYSFHCRSFLA